MNRNFIFYHPTLSAVIGVSLIAVVETVFVAIILCMYYLFKFLTNPEGLRPRRDSDEDDESSQSDDDDDSISQVAHLRYTSPLPCFFSRDR